MNKIICKPSDIVFVQLYLHTHILIAYLEKTCVNILWYSTCIKKKIKYSYFYYFLNSNIKFILIHIQNLFLNFTYLKKEINSKNTLN